MRCMTYYFFGIRFDEVLSCYFPYLRDKLSNALCEVAIASIESAAFFEEGETTSFGTGFRIDKDKTLIALGQGPILFPPPAMVKAYVEYIIVEEEVTRIPKRCFAGSRATSVIHRGYVHSIGEEAYSDMPYVEEADINTFTIPQGCFKNDVKLREFHLGESVFHVKENAFKNCPLLNVIYYYGDRNNFANIKVEDGNEAFVKARVFFMQNE